MVGNAPAAGPDRVLAERRVTDMAQQDGDPGVGQLVANDPAVAPCGDRRRGTQQAKGL
jgi:hypothetical protein